MIGTQPVAEGGAVCDPAPMTSGTKKALVLLAVDHDVAAPSLAVALAGAVGAGLVPNGERRKILNGIHG